MRALRLKNEQIVIQWQEEIKAKNIEIEVVKEMVKGVQIQLKAKESDYLRLNKKLLQAEGI